MAEKKSTKTKKPTKSKGKMPKVPKKSYPE